ncbi:DUF4174 domain-containing protein [Pseudotabrizicola sp. L79]|uniref:DUF4174 domain-containing protein n=1 Tax=Pseudotabrizicola sp. L79 TaxID=3118402 RepID=UPI002F939A44
MKPLYVLVLSALLPLAAAAQSGAEASQSSVAQGQEAAPFAPVSASEVAFDSLLYVARPIVVFADSPNDPNYLRQMELLAADYPSLQDRDVILITDTDPAAKGEWRVKLRPRGFSLVLMDKDLKPVIRKPLPWEVREITRAIDKFPLRRQEVLERNPAGR